MLCEPTAQLVELIDVGDLDLAIITHCDASRPTEVIRRERLLWVTSNRHSTHHESPLPLALGPATCSWRKAAIERLQAAGRAHRILYTSRNAGAIAAAVLSGLAVSVFPESGMRPGMRVLGQPDNFPTLPAFDIGLLRNRHETSALADALATHIVQGLDNLTDVAAE